MNTDIIQPGHYIVIQRQNYKKLCKFNTSSTTVSLNRETVELAAIEECKYFSSFKMIAKGKQKNRVFSLEQTKHVKGLKEVLDIKVSGSDNRNIVDDGRSQNLSTEQIVALRDTEDHSSKKIVETLISNSKTFHSKTEYSQDKYLKKKEKKYFEYLEIRKPNIRLIAEIMYRLDPGKVLGIRIDTLSQIMTYSNVNSSGRHLLYDSGSNGLLSAALLNAIGTNTDGKLIHMHPGNMSQKQALLAMNFEKEQLERCISVNIYSVLRHHYRSKPESTKRTATVETIKIVEEKAIKANLKRPLECERGEETENKIFKSDETVEIITDNITDQGETTDKGETTAEATSTVITEACQNKNIADLPQNDETTIPRRPKWQLDNEMACEVLKDKMHSLVIACKEHPLNIFKELVQFMTPSSPFVIYFNAVEPLQECYVALRARSDIAALKLTNNWMRGYQILPERTHPEVSMNNNSGFLLTGYILK